MRKRILMGILVLAAAAGIILAAGGCRLIFTTTTPFGKVVNVKTGEGVAGIEIRLVYQTTASTTDKDSGNISDTGYYTAITTTTGEFDFENEAEGVPFGNYIVRGVDDDYAFFEYQISITEYRQDIGTLSALAASESGLALVLMWNDTFNDVDAYLTYPKKDAATTTGTAPAMTSPYDTAEADGNALSGFSPEKFGTTAAVGSAREVVFFDNPSTASDASATWNGTTYTNTLDQGTFDADTDLDGTNDAYYISLDVDATLGSGPETITIKMFPFLDAASNLNTTGGGTTGLPSGTYTWVGVMEYYVNAFDSDWADSTNDTSTDYLADAGTGESADAVLYVVDGTTVKGKYTVPSYTQIKSSSLLRINCFYDPSDNEVYQFIPDIRVLQSTDEVRGLDDSGIITVTRAAGRR